MPGFELGSLDSLKLKNEKKCNFMISHNQPFSQKYYFLKLLLVWRERVNYVDLSHNCVRTRWMILDSCEVEKESINSFLTPYGRVVNVIDCDIIKSEIEILSLLFSLSDNYCWARYGPNDTFSYGSNSITIFPLQGWLWH